MLDKSCTVAQPCGRNLSIVRNGRPVQAEGRVSPQRADGNAIVGSHLWIPEGSRGGKGREEVACLQIIFNNRALRMGKEGLRSKMTVLKRGV